MGAQNKPMYSLTDDNDVSAASVGATAAPSAWQLAKLSLVFPSNNMEGSFLDLMCSVPSTNLVGLVNLSSIVATQQIFVEMTLRIIRTQTT